MTSLNRFKKLINNKKFISRFINFLNIAVILFLLYLPYYLFDGRLFLGGDDTRLHYIYPVEFLNNLSLFSWVNISSLPSYLPNHHSIPFLTFFALLNNIFSSKTQVFYFAFSLPFILGFIYFQKFFRVLINDVAISFVAALIFIFSPITIVSQMSYFLFSIYLVALIPIVSYYYSKYVVQGKAINLLRVVIWSIILSIAFYGIQWIFAILFILILSLALLIAIDNPIKKIFKRTLIFGYFVLASQLFWAIPFLASLTYRGANELGGKVSSQSFLDSFTQTVNSTATGSVIYPMLTFYQRRIAFDYDWHLKHIFENYFDYILPLSIVFVIVLLTGLTKFNNVLSRNQKKVFIFFTISFFFAIYFSTVNIVFLKEVFLVLGNIPGFAIFRNFTDKFALAYIYIYSALLGMCLFVVKKSSKYYWLLTVATVLVVFVNFIPVKKIVTSPLWKTDTINTTVNISNEYFDFAKKVKAYVKNDVNIIAFPQNITSYAVISEENNSNAYVGTSPFKFFTGINDLTGESSYPPRISQEIKKLIMNKQYDKLLALLSNINTGYLMVTNNVPDQVINSYLYEKEYISYQDQGLIDALTEREIVKSSKGNYILYKLKNNPAIMSSETNVVYDKVSPIEYKIIISGIKSNTNLSFLESYHPGWKLYPAKTNDFYRLFNKPLFENTHFEKKLYGNEWVISREEIKKSERLFYVDENEDGSVNITLTMYFSSQNYFYLGILLTFVSLCSGAIYILKSNKINHEG